MSTIRRLVERFLSSDKKVWWCPTKLRVASLILSIAVALGTTLVVDSSITYLSKATKIVETPEEIKLERLRQELYSKIALTENRIIIIKQLRAEQHNPAIILSRINERIPIGINLDSIIIRDNLI